MEFENLEIGNEEPELTEKPVVVVNYNEVDVKTSEKETNKKLVLLVDHPDKSGLELSKVKYEKKKKLVESGLWLHKDKNGKVPFNSAVAFVLRFYDCKNIKELIQKKLETTKGESGYLIIKAY